MPQDVLPFDGIETGVLYREDNLTQLARFPDESVDLVYLDPPFFSNRSYEVIWGDEAEVRSFEDRWEGGMQHYIGWMQERCIQLHRVLKKTGSFWLHCDPHASHYLKVMLDQIFDPNLFRNEVIWKRTGAHSSAHRAGPVHDVLLFYTKSDTYTWNRVYLPHNREYVRTHYTQTDPDGRRWSPNDLTASGPRQGSSGQPWRGFDPGAKRNHWKFTIPNLERLDREGRIYWPPNGGWPRYKRYLDEVPGLLLQDVWTDIPPLNSMAKERKQVGYPTQKPEALLERIINATSNEGDVILDPFCGCGTTVAVAFKRDREFIGIDISPSAIEVMRARLRLLGCDPIIVNPPDSIPALKEMGPFEFQNWIINAIMGEPSPRPVGDMGIDGYSFLTREPVQIKQQERVGRNVIDNFETAIQRDGHSSGFVIAFSFTRGAHEEVARVRKEGLDIKLVRVGEILLTRKQAARLPVVLPQQGDVLTFIPPVRKKEDRRKAAELMASQHRAVG